MKTNKLWLPLTVTLALHTSTAHAVVFTTNTTIGVGTTTYDGQPVVVSDCTLTVDGVHNFASLVLTTSAVLTHTSAQTGEPDNRLDLAIAGDLTIDTTSRVDVNAKGYGPVTGPGAGTNSGYSTFSGGLTALGGLATGAFAGHSGGAGTVYTKASSQSVGDLRLDNSGITNAMETPITAPVAYRLTLTHVTAYAIDSLTLTGLPVSAGGLLTHPFQGPRLHVLVLGDAVLENGGTIGTDSRGYPLKTGPGAGSGGGGRIAIYAGVNEFAGNVLASGGASASRPGGNGTVHYGPNVPGGLISWWRGEGEAIDTMGVHPGTAQGSVSYPTAQLGRGFFFDSSDDRVDVPHDATFNPSTGGFTAQFWLRGTRAQPDSFSALLDKSHGFTDSTGWTVHCWTNNGHVSFAIGQGGDSTDNFPTIYSLTDVLDGRFHQVTAVWTGEEAQLFVDGTLEAHLAMSPPVNNTRPLCLGYAWGGGTPQRFFRGVVDEVMIFNRALAPAEIASTYFNQGGPLTLSVEPTPGGVLLSWPVGAESFGLVSRTNLTAGDWESVTNSPSLNGVRKEVNLPANTPVHRFFRLAQ